MEQQGKRNAWVNGTLIVLNILYFLYLETAGTSEDTLFMIRHGAMYTPLIVQKGQYYRLLTSMFMHFGIHHIANNMLVLFILGGTGTRKHKVYDVLSALWNRSKHNINDIRDGRFCSGRVSWGIWGNFRGHWWPPLCGGS